MFENLKKAVADHYNERREAVKIYVERGYFPTWNEKERRESDRGLGYYSTPARWDAYQAGTLSREKAVELAIKRALREVDKDEAGELAKIAAAEGAPVLSFVEISVEWKRSSVWGLNPSVTVWTDTGHYHGKAGGCGYDKQSAAVAEALNQCPAVLRVLYTMKEKGLDNPPELGRCAGGGCVEDRRSSNSILGYGAGYGVLPYFEGGVGVSCFWSIFEKAGYKCRSTASGKMFDGFTVEKKEVA